MRSLSFFETRDVNDVYDGGIIAYYNVRRLAMTEFFGSGEKRSEKYEEISNFVEALTAVEINPENNIINGRTEDILAVFHACGGAYTEYISKEEALAIRTLILKNIGRIMEGNQEFWKVKLFISAVPELLLTASASSRQKIRSVCENCLPQVMTAYRNWKDWSRYQETETILRYIRLIC